VSVALEADATDGRAENLLRVPLFRNMISSPASATDTSQPALNSDTAAGIENAVSVAVNNLPNLVVDDASGYGRPHQN